ncbi:MAG: FAD-dependent oxidoreductase [Lachnospiraceae bacterium]|nr:FAD-dependent oxidoreductase [Lachnospiraceae bacterium]
MIRVTQVKLPAGHTPEALKKKLAKLLKLAPEAILEIQIKKQSLDARKKPELYYSYTVDVRTEQEETVIHKAKNPQIVLAKEETYHFPDSGTGHLKNPPVIIGTGPAGLFCGLMLARHGYRPILLERGADVDTRQRQVDHFWATGELDTRSNVQFGEGGAGTFSDGKLNTLVKDPLRRNQLVLELFHEFGADPAILYQNKPHIGTDVLSGIVKRMREEILRLGGEVRFGCQVTDLELSGGRIAAVLTADGSRVPAEAVVLAIGHSARDTFAMLQTRGVPMDAKAFAVGLRIQHPQKLINLSQYGMEEAGALGAASYKLTRQTKSGRGVYSFCMCPGGYVVNASSEEGRLAVNGMSYHARTGDNANSALIVTVTPEDFPDRSALGGVAFQRQLEERAFAAAGGRIPVQLYGDFRKNRLSVCAGAVDPEMRGQWAFADVRGIMPEALNEALLEAMEGFGGVIRGFNRPDAVLAGIESRTSSPVRIWRDEQFESTVGGLYPCGEGAGYAGGITSAAMDGVKVAEAIAQTFGRLS